MSDASFTFNPYAQDDGRIDLGVDLREGTIPAGARTAVTPNPQPEPEPEDLVAEDEVPEPEAPEPPDPQPDPDAAASGDPESAPPPEAKVLTRGGKQTQPRTGPRTRSK